MEMASMIGSWKVVLIQYLVRCSLSEQWYSYEYDRAWSYVGPEKPL